MPKNKNKKKKMQKKNNLRKTNQEIEYLTKIKDKKKAE
jgi:hypothetical protein